MTLKGKRLFKQGDKPEDLRQDIYNDLVRTGVLIEQPEPEVKRETKVVKTRKRNTSKKRLTK